MNKLLVALLIFGLTPTLCAQGEGEEEGNIEEIVRQIRRNMQQVENDLSALEIEAARERGDQVKEDLERLIESAKAAGQQIPNDIDEIIKRMKL
jgi:hypothetical protein